ncbi:hypothetical protein RRG08_003750 [Elysia crispata]|uniref:Uncharacterized protein n=1 Tax=Elysia crispata TaxID=231223 RepID=A0AAE1AVF4_9GAST|nr:hypothetical protein RRG08_003750 [Elysia crispata]
MWEYLLISRSVWKMFLVAKKQKPTVNEIFKSNMAMSTGRLEGIRPALSIRCTSNVHTILGSGNKFHEDFSLFLSSQIVYKSGKATGTEETKQTGKDNPSTMRRFALIPATFPPPHEVSGGKPESSIFIVLSVRIIVSYLLLTFSLIRSYTVKSLESSKSQQPIFREKVEKSDGRQRETEDDLECPGKAFNNQIPSYILRNSKFLHVVWDITPRASDNWSISSATKHLLQNYISS